MVVFDLSRRATFDRAELWLKTIAGTSPDVPMVLVGNKSDLTTKKAVDYNTAKVSRLRCMPSLLEHCTGWERRG